MKSGNYATRHIQPAYTIANTPELLSVLKWVKIVGISKSTLYRWIEDGRLHACYVGTHMRVGRGAMQARLDTLPVWATE